MATIPLVASTIRPIEQPDVLQNYARLAQLRGLQQEQARQAQQAPYQQQILQQRAQAGQMENQQTAAGLQEHAAAMQAIQEAGGDVRKALPKIMQVAPNAGMAYKKQLDEWDAADLTKKLNMIKLSTEKTARLGQLAGSVTDQASYQNAIQQAAQEQLLDPQTAQQLAQQPYDPAKVKGLQMQALTTQQQLAQTAQDLQRQETERHNKAMETKPAAAMEGLQDFLKAKEASLGRPMTAMEGLAARNEYYQRNKSQVSMSSANDSDIKDAAEMIKSGQAPPVLTEYSFRDRTKLAAELHRQGYNLAGAEQDWKATQKFLQTANGAQQTRLRQAITALPDLTDKIEGLYDEWSKLAPTSGYRVLNKASLAAMKNLPGRPGAVAQALDAQIADAVSDLAVVYMGGNSPTDHGLALAQKNLSADWNDATFKEGLKQLKLNAQIRKNSLAVGPVGVSGNSPYPGNMGSGNPPSSNNDPLGIR